MSVSNKFEGCLTMFGEAMKQSYLLNEEGEPIELPEDQMADINNIIQVSQDRVSDAFRPLFEDVEKQIAENKKEIEQLQHILNLRKQEGSNEDLNMEGLPTAEWLLANRKSKSDKPMTGYNAFTMWYMAENKSGFPPKGTWEQQNKAAWNVLAAQVNSAHRDSDSSSASSSSSIELPETKGKGTKITAYNMYTTQYMKDHPGEGFPPKGSWANLPKEEVARYQAQADALKASRA